MPNSDFNILLVEDDAQLMRILHRWLEQAAYNVVCATDGQKAMVAMLESCPHFVITDWQIPFVDGADLCRWIRAQQLPHHVYTMLMSGRSGSDRVVEALESGADDFLPKPFDKNILLARIQAGVRLVELEQRLSRLAGVDPLTDLSTRRSFFELANPRWQQKIPMSCVMIDVDFLKRINDLLGHQVGDAALRAIAAVLRDSCREKDLIARYGGEEFCVLLPKTTEAEAIEWAEGVRTRLSERTDLVEGTTVSVTASFGVAQRTEDIESFEQFVDLADQALLVAKRSGRDRVVGFYTMTSAESGPIEGNGPAAVFQGLVAKQVMTTIVAPLSQEDAVGRAARYFLRFRFHSAPVVDKSGRLVGMLSERDVMSIMVAPKWWNTKVKDVMNQNVVSYEEDDPVLVIYEFLCRAMIRGIVIVKDGQPTGLINRTSLLRWITNRLRTPVSEPTVNHFGGPSLELTSDDNIQMIIHAIAEQSRELERRFNSDQEDHLPLIIGGVSRIEELLNDLLSYSRSATQSPLGALSDPLATSDSGGGIAADHAHAE